jgi:Pyruvate/2-oxoacid:ferredoxin oxidoreductase gamma subunit
VNYFDVNISDKNEKFLTKYCDIILAFNAQSINAQIHALKENGTIIINKKWVEKIDADLSKYQVLDLEISDKYDNTYLLGIYALFLNLDLDIILDKIEKVFARK